VSEAPNPDRWKALAVCLVGGAMVLLDVSIVNVALPSIQKGIGAAESELQWVVSGYALTFGLLLVPAGRIGDLHGRRVVFVSALGLFTLASAVCGFAPNGIALVLARLVQGLAGGSVTPQISATIQEVFSGRERGKAFGAFGTVVGVSTAVGPLLGGLLIQIFGETEGWRAVFFVNVPIGLVAMPLAWKLLPRRSVDTPRKRHDLDLVGVVLLGLGVVVLLMPFVQSREWGSWRWWLVPVSVVLLTAFVVWERTFRARGRESMVDLALFRRRSYSSGTAMITLYFAGFTPLFFVFTLFLQVGLHYTALEAGLSITPFAIGFAIAAAIGGRKVSDLGRPLIAMGLTLVLIGLIATVVAVHLAPEHGTAWATLVPLAIAGFGGGLVISPNQALTLAEVPVQEAGTASGLLQTGQRVGSAVGIAAAGSVFFAAVASSGGDFATAFERGITVALAFVAAAFLLAVAEVVAGRRSADTAGQDDDEYAEDHRDDKSRTQPVHHAGGGD
jgi:EmrB/QacA subfamily drug resistance transporter